MSDSTVETPEIGLHRGIPEFDYRAWSALNQSTLWTFRKSAAHARYEFLHPKATDATDLGSAIHAVALEPESLEERYAVRPPGIDRRTREGKALWAEFVAQSEGKTVLEKPDVYETLEGVRESLARHPLAFDLLVRAPGYTEVSAVWRDEETGILCKGRMDRIVEHAGWTWVVDLKSTDRDASPFGFGRTVMNYGYHVQHAFYLDGLDALATRDRRFAFVVVEKQPPYEIAVYELDLVFAELGRDEYRRYMRRWQQCMETGHWPGYPDTIETLEAPQWVASRLSTLEEAA